MHGRKYKFELQIVRVADLAIGALKAVMPVRVVLSRLRSSVFRQANR